MIDHFPRRLTISFSILAAILCLGTESSFAFQKEKEKKSAAKKSDTQPQAKPKVKLKPSLTRLADPSVAKLLNLSDKQRAQVSTLMNERVDAIAKAKTADREKVKSEYQRKLADVLDADQLKKALHPKPIPKLLFDFRFQKWEDVLDWYATESDLSLVMSAPPPGTFNFSDTKEYTPTDALDLLNSVLATKDFTLIRRGRMLMVLDISEGVPQGVVPEIKLEDLDERGKYEIVKVKFPLGRRDVKGVNNEIKEMLGRHGKAIPLLLTKQLLVQAPAGVMKAIKIVIEEIPEPPVAKKTSPASKPKPATPEKPEFRTYEFKKADPMVGKELAEKIFEGIKIVKNPNLAELSVYTVPSQHAVIKKIFDKLEESNAADVRPRLELYSVPNNNADQIIETLKLIAKTAVMRFNSKTKKLEVVGTPREHKAIKENLPLLTGRSPLKQTPGYRQVQTYKINHAELSAITQTLQTIFPDAFITPDASTKNVIIFTTAEDQRGVKNIIESLDQAEKKIPEIKVISYEETPTSMLTSTLTKIAPQSQITYDSDAKRFIFIGPKEELPKVEETIKLFAASQSAKEKNKLVIYAVTTVQKARFHAVLTDLQTELPGIKVMAETNPGELAIWAKPAQHKVLGNILKELAGDKTAGKQSLKGYDLKDSDSTQTLALLKQLFPTLSFIPDANSKRLMLMTDEATHKKVKAAFDQIVTDKPKTIYRFYPIEHAYPADMVSILSKLVPNAQITQDDSGRRIVVVATEKDQASVKSALDDILKHAGPQEKNTLAIYPVTPTQKKRLDAVQADLLTQFPGIKIMPETNPGEIAIWAKPSQHKVLKEMIDGLGKGDKFVSETLKGYDLMDSDGPQTTTLLQKIFPKLSFIHDANAKRLLVMADSDTHKKILDAIGQIVSVKEKPGFHVYDIGNADATQLQSTLKSLVPDAKLFVDAGNRKLSAMATAKEHTKIKEVVDAVKRDPSIDTTDQVVVYRLKKADPQTTQSLLKGLFPKATFAVDTQTKSIVAVAVPKDHKGIEALMEQVDTEEGTTLKLYPFDNNLPSNIVPILTKLAPGAQITKDETSRQIMVVASTKDQAIVELTIKKFRETRPREKRILTLYQMSQSQLKRFDAIEADLKKDNPSITVIKDTQQGEVSIWATFTQHQSIKETIDQITKGMPVSRKQQLAAYSLQIADPETATKILKSLFESIRVIPEKETRQLFIWATPEVHKSIDIIVKSIDSPDTSMGKKKFRVWSTQNLDPTVTLNVLKQAFPKVTFAADSTAGTVIAKVNDEQNSEVTEFMGKLTSTSNAKSNRLTARRYKAKFPRVKDGINFVRALVPKAQVHVDVRGGYVTILATENDHEMFQEAFAIQNFEKRNNILRAYESDTTNAKDLRNILKGLVPDALIGSSKSGRKILAFATAEDQEQIEAIVKLMKEKTGNRELKRYEVKYNGRGNIRKLLLNMIDTGIVVTNEASTNFIWVLATPEEHKTVTQIIDQLEKQKERKGTEFKNYDLIHSNVKSIQRTITKRYSEVEFWPSNVKNRLIIEATPKEHTAIKKLIDMLEKQNEKTDSRVEIIYPVENLTPAQAQTSLNKTITGLTFLPINQPQKIYILAEAKQHELVVKRLKQLEIANARPTNTSLQKYVFQNTTAAAIKKYVSSRMTGISFQNGPDAQTLFSEVTQADDLKIRDLIGQLEAAYKKDDTRKLRTFDVKNSGTSTAQSVITALVPGISFLPSGDTKSLLALLSDKEHQRITEIVKQLESQYNSKERSPKTYTLKNITVADARTTISTMFSQATMLSSADPNKLIVLASLPEHILIGSMMKRLDDEYKSDRAISLAIYDVENTTAPKSQQVLEQKIKNVTFIPTPDGMKLMAWANADDHKTIREIVDELEKINRKDYNLIVKTYTVVGTTVADMQIVLPAMFPKAKFTASSDPNKIIVTAKPDDHSAIKQILDEVAKSAATDKLTLQSYSVKYTGATAAQSVLSQTIKNVTFIPSADGLNMMAWASAVDHAKIKQIVDELEKTHRLPNDKVLRTYSVEGATVVDIRSILSSMFPEATITASSEPNKIFVTGNLDEHVAIKIILDGLANNKDARKIPRTYTVKNISVADARTMVSNIYAQATILSSNDPLKFIVVANDKDHQSIEKMLDSLEKQNGPKGVVSLVTYVVENTTATSALKILTQRIPNVTFIPSADGTKLMAWANLDDHKKIKIIVDDLEESNRPNFNKVVKTFEVIGATVADMRTVLDALIPKATFTLSSEPNKIIVTATEEEHVSIKKILDRIKLDKDRSKRTIVSYDVEYTGASSAQAALSDTVKNVTFIPSTDGTKLMAWATAIQHKEIKGIVEKLEASNRKDEDRIIKTYMVTGVTVADLQTALTPMFPKATLVASSEPNKVVITAKTVDHAAIERILKILDKDNADPTRSLKSYNVEYTGAGNAQTALSQTLKNVTFIPSADKKRLMAWATAKEHKLIETTVEEFEKANQPNHDRFVKNYTIEGATVADMRSLLATKYPEATFRPSSEPNQLIALATPFEHEGIAKILSYVETFKKGKLSLKTYEVPNTGASNAEKVLSLAFPQVKFMVGNDKDKLFALATAEDHKTIAVMVDDLDTSGVANRKLIMKVYQAVATGASNAQKILQQAYPKAKFYTGVDPSKLIIWAKEEEHKKMKELIDDLEVFDSRKRESKAYSIGENVDARTIAALLAPLKREKVTITTDAQNNLLVALATAEQHIQIKKAIDQFLQAIPASSKPTSEVYRFEFADPRAAQTVLTALVPKAKIAIDASQKALVVSANTRDHAIIKETVAKMDDPEANIGQKRLKTHLFAKTEPRNLLNVVKAVFQKDKSVNLSMDEQNRVLIAVATEKQHKMIADLVAQLEATLGTGKDSLVFYPLKGGLNVNTAESIVKNMLKAEGLRAQITKENFTNQLIVSAEQKVHRKIGEILVKLEGDQPELEVFQLENIDPEKTAEAIDELFDNSGFQSKPGAPIVSGDDSTGQLFVRATKEQMKKIKDLLRKMGETNLDPTKSSNIRKIRKIRIDGDMQKTIDDITKLWSEMRKNPIKVIGSPKDNRVRDARKKLKELQKKKKSPKEKRSSLDRSKNNLSFVSLENDQKTEPQQKKAPIFIFPGDGQITIASDDAEALNEFEKLLNSLKPRRGFSGRNYTVFMLRNAGARTVSESLKNLFKSTEGSSVGRGPVVVVPDERLNAIVIHANRSDRAMIESLLEILDSEDIIDSKSLVKPRRIVVKNTRASRIAEVLRNLYRTHLTSGGGRKPIPIPSGLSPELAAVLQQVNATSTGPLMTLDVDETSNSIIVMAPASLTDEVESLVNDLDEASVKDRQKRVVKIFQLNKAKASRVQRQLQFFIQKPSRRRRR